MKLKFKRTIVPKIANITFNCYNLKTDLSRKTSKGKEKDHSV